MKIKNLNIGKNYPPFIIAEAGINHNGDIKIALDMIDAAHKIGATAIKFQTYKSDLFISPESEYFDLFKKCELDEDDIKKLFFKAKQLGLIIFSAVFDFESANLWNKLECPVFKIASGDITHHALMNHVAKFNKPMILSTGGSNLEEISEAIKVIKESNSLIDIAILHCISNYPTKNSEANLSTLKLLRDTFNLTIGFSDHTIGSIASISAVSLGANIIEKHFTLDCNMEGPDHILSMDKKIFKQFIIDLNDVQSTLGVPQKNALEDKKTIIAIRRSLVASKNIKKGELLGLDNILFRRPAKGISADKITEVIGKKTIKNISANDFISWNDYN